MAALDGSGFSDEQMDRRHQESRRTKPALQRMVPRKCRLQRMQFSAPPALRQWSLARRRLQREQRAGFHRATVEKRCRRRNSWYRNRHGCRSAAPCSRMNSTSSMRGSIFAAHFLAVDLHRDGFCRRLSIIEMRLRDRLALAAVFDIVEGTPHQAARAASACRLRSLVVGNGSTKAAAMSAAPPAPAPVDDLLAANPRLRSNASGVSPRQPKPMRAWQPVTVVAHLSAQLAVG